MRHPFAWVICPCSEAILRAPRSQITTQSHLWREPSHPEVWHNTMSVFLLDLCELDVFPKFSYIFCLFVSESEIRSTHRSTDMQCRNSCILLKKGKAALSHEHALNQDFRWRTGAQQLGSISHSLFSPYTQKIHLHWDWVNYANEVLFSGFSGTAFTLMPMPILSDSIKTY